MTSSSYDNIASPSRGNTDFPNHLERRFTPGRFRGIGYTAGLEIWAAKTTSIVHRNTVISRTCKSEESQFDCPRRGAVPLCPGRCGLSLFLLGFV